jgi:hypothetical protein
MATTRPPAPPLPAATSGSAPVAALNQDAPAAPDQASLAFTGPPIGEQAAEGVAIAPTVQGLSAIDAADPTQTQDLFWMMALAVMAIPGFLLMTLIATVLIRR